jgi:hypothetical protein
MIMPGIVRSVDARNVWRSLPPCAFDTARKSGAWTDSISVSRRSNGAATFFRTDNFAIRRGTLRSSRLRPSTANRSLELFAVTLPGKRLRFNASNGDFGRAESNKLSPQGLGLSSERCGTMSGRSCTHAHNSTPCSDRQCAGRAKREAPRKMMSVWSYCRGAA